jgi:hydrogenase maturation protein HypF
MCSDPRLRYAELTIDYEIRVDPSSAARRIRQSVRVRGVVQGVGFRPFVYRLAAQNQLGGHIGNDTDGVAIEIEGLEPAVADFLKRLTSEAPPISRIDSVQVDELAPTGETAFTIVHSQVLGQVSTGIPADAATCAECLRELLDPHDRRYRYPFLNCTNCGPRFTITRRIPYDRPQTSMAVFPMCSACQAEYDDPLNRRFHAQPNACWDCGPHVWLESPTGEEIAFADPIAQCLEELLAGRIMAIKGIGGFHLAVDATSESAVTRLRERKHRYGKPLAVMVRDMDAAHALCVLDNEEAVLLQTPARPIVLARSRASNGIAPSVAPGIPWLGVYLPYAPLQHLLFADPRVRALVMTSANLSEEPIAIDNREARERLGSIADAFLMHNREILQRCDDSVVAIVDGAPQLLRRARGYVPLGIVLPLDAPPLLAVGGHLKSVFTLARGRFAYQSQHLGDLESLTGLDFFTESLAHLTHTFEIEPQAVIHDLHPGYLSTTWAKQWSTDHNLPTIAVQHHHAHIAACMAEHAIDGPVIGLSLDGTGYGTDGHIWGGEVLIADYDKFDRFAHLDYVAMPGGDAAVREPWRMAFAHLLAAGFDPNTAGTLGLVGATEHEARIVRRMLERGINTPLTSSLGRLFDAVAAVVLNRRNVDYEAQAAIELEGLAADQDDEVAPESYTLQIRGGDWSKHEPAIISAESMWHALVLDMLNGVDKSRIAARFHAGVGAGFARAAMRAQNATGISTVALSGGVMHNRRLTRMLRRKLESEGLHVFEHRRISPGDGGLSYGQAVIGATILNRT